MDIICLPTEKKRANALKRMEPQPQQQCSQYFVTHFPLPKIENGERKQQPGL